MLKQVLGIVASAFVGAGFVLDKPWCYLAAIAAGALIIVVRWL